MKVQSGLSAAAPPRLSRTRLPLTEEEVHRCRRKALGFILAGVVVSLPVSLFSWLDTAPPGYISDHFYEFNQFMAVLSRVLNVAGCWFWARSKGRPASLGGVLGFFGYIGWIVLALIPAARQAAIPPVGRAARHTMAGAAVGAAVSLAAGLGYLAWCVLGPSNPHARDSSSWYEDYVFGMLAGYAYSPLMLAVGGVLGALVGYSVFLMRRERIGS